MTTSLQRIDIKRYSLKHVLKHDKVLFNTNNHHGVSGENRPNDYDRVNDKGNTGNWVDRFHKGNYFKLTLGTKDMRWLREASKVGLLTGRFSSRFNDELKQTCQTYARDMEIINKHLQNGEKGWFIRTEPVSLKNGLYGAGPYRNLEAILKSMVTGSYGHECFGINNTHCNLYFLRWRHLHPQKEFRIFVYKNNITAISDQKLYSVNSWLCTMTDTQIRQLVRKIVTYFNKHVQNKMSDFENYVMDFALVGKKETPYFIEPNSFGAQYASGSALFHWVRDHNVLHTPNTIEFRYVHTE